MVAVCYEEIHRRNQPTPSSRARSNCQIYKNHSYLGRRLYFIRYLYIPLPAIRAEYHAVTAVAERC